LAEIGQQAQRFIGVAGLVSQIIGHAAKSVDVAKILPQMPRKQQRDDRKILVMAGGQLARSGLCGRAVRDGGAGQLDRRSFHKSAIFNVLARLPSPILLQKWKPL